ncbi:MAG: phosphomannomutase, partial [Gammaproteobacteria bacterium]|nr:phosphomannomutase [Gammaproteobacteria bacterium]
QLLKTNLNDQIVHDPRLVWNTREEVNKFGGTPLLSKAGHSFIKEIMRENQAVYGGEMSGHHYFRDFYYSDSGMIPWLLLIENICSSGETLTNLVKERMNRYPVSGEINTKVDNPKKLLESIKEYYLEFNPLIDDLDGYSFEFSNWRFNLRISNTEPLVRLNVESKDNQQLMEEKTEEILKLIKELS